MATDRQIEANRKNAARSTGPKTDEGKARSRLNATTHGLAGESPEVGRSPEFADRRAKWAAEEKPVGQAGNWALDRAVAASLRIERCEQAVDELTAAAQQRARLGWDQDREVEAAKVFARLGRDPVLASRQLMTGLAGVGLLIEAWLGLLAKLRDEGDWSEVEEARALDLLGTPIDLRAGRTMIESPDGSDAVAHRVGLALDEVERLEQLRDDALIPLDESERARAIRGHMALLSKPAALILRYERDAWKRYREAMAAVRYPEANPAPPASAEVAPIVVVEPHDADAEGEDAEEAWLDAMERQIDALCVPRSPATDRTQFAGHLVAAMGG